MCHAGIAFTLNSILRQNKAETVYVNNTNNSMSTHSSTSAVSLSGETSKQARNEQYSCFLHLSSRKSDPSIGKDDTPYFELCWFVKKGEEFECKRNRHERKVIGWWWCEHTLGSIFQQMTRSKIRWRPLALINFAINLPQPRHIRQHMASSLCWNKSFLYHRQIAITLFMRGENTSKCN